MGDCNKKSLRNEFLSVRLHDRNDFFVFERIGYLFAFFAVAAGRDPTFGHADR